MTPGRVAATLKLVEFASHFFGVSEETIMDFVEEHKAGRKRIAPVPGLPRWQDVVLEQEIPEGASVLDLGCGCGDLLSRLMETRHVRGQGIELDPEAVASCIARGVPVIQSDLDEGLRGFPDGSFDLVVLEETLQTLRRPMGVLNEMLRIGRKGAVSFPNFAFWKVWIDFAIRGRMPVTGTLPYEWHDSPNVHLFTFRDFSDWAENAGVLMSEVFVLSEGRINRYREEDDFLGEEMLVFVEKPV